MQRLIAALSVLSLATAGCLGSGDADDADPVEPTTEDAAADSTAPTAPPRVDVGTIEGSVTTVHAGVIGANTPGSDTSAPLDVPDGALRVTLNVTATGGELSVLVGAPGCEANSGCEEEHVTRAGTASILLGAAESGAWTLRFFGAANGPSTVEYVVHATTVRPAA